MPKNENEEFKEKQLLTQREAVYRAVCSLVKNKGIKVKKKQPVKEVLDSENLQSIYKDIARGFRSGKITLKDNPSNKKKLADPQQMQNYIVGLVSNWFKRDGRLNGEEDLNLD